MLRFHVNGITTMSSCHLRVLSFPWNSYTNRPRFVGKQYQVIATRYYTYSHITTRSYIFGLKKQRNDALVSIIDGHASVRIFSFSKTEEYLKEPLFREMEEIILKTEPRDLAEIGRNVSWSVWYQKKNENSHYFLNTPHIYQTYSLMTYTRIEITNKLFKTI